MKHYQERCLREEPDGEWSDSRYSPANDLVNIFASLWRDSSVPRPVLEDLRDWLGRLYEQGDSDIRTCIVQATLIDGRSALLVSELTGFVANKNFKSLGRNVQQPSTHQELHPWFDDSFTRATRKFSALQPEGVHAQRAPVEIDRNA